ncbi:macrophage mannose receptor 1-like [Hyla sarda]|uniref:macrophage mannose receptor 1-like n=1 Tax=Hyla sarda TaxID=327740 RepID=UPI0024C25AC2|nr:macrophage mannose receptor 1-like [Hyla sarda]XP_056375197.1 macrophage mannose receptor 1-like [Hyla sarda]XP_056375198.1 macrophage mannose receptor 1-like [Hyla sarda]
MSCVMMHGKKGTWTTTWCFSYKGYICKAMKTPLPTEKTTEKPEEKPSHGLTIGVVVLLVIAASAIAVFFAYRRKWNKSQPEIGLDNRIYLDSNCEDGTQDASVLIENIEQNENAKSI